MKNQELLERARKVIKKERRDLENELRKTGGTSHTLQQTGQGIMGITNTLSGAYNTGMSKHTGGFDTTGYGTRGGYSPSQDEDALARLEDRKIGPFTFDVDNDIETEVLVNEQVQEDLNQLKEILDQGQENIQMSIGRMGKSKRKKKFN